MTRRTRSWAAGSLAAALLVIGCQERQPPSSGRPPASETRRTVVVQLNGAHGPRYAAQYLLVDSAASPVEVRPGGPGVSPLAEVLAGRAQFAVAEVDLFLRHLGENPAEPGRSDLVCVFVEYQRSPIGWVVHPDVARKLGLPDAARADPGKVNRWAADLVRGRQLRVGDRRGTGTAAVWLQWRDRHALPADTPVVSVGADPALFLAAPMMLFPADLDRQVDALSDRLRQEGRGDAVVVDPSADGIALYGDVIVARRDLVATDAELVDRYQRELRQAWAALKADPERAAAQLHARCPGVPAPALTLQVRRSLGYAFVAGRAPGQMDATAKGTWVATLRALQEAGSVNRALTPEQVLGALAPPQ